MATGARREFQLSMPKEQVELEFSILIHDLYLLYRKYFNRKMQAMNLTATQWQVLSCVVRREGITQTEIADLLYKGKSPIGKTLDSLEASGWINREASAEDRRRKHIFLTDKLSSIDDQVLAVLAEMNQVAEQHLDGRIIEGMRTSLAGMRENLRNALGERTDSSGESS